MGAIWQGAVLMQAATGGNPTLILAIVVAVLALLLGLAVGTAIGMRMARRRKPTPSRPAQPRRRK